MSDGKCWLNTSNGNSLPAHEILLAEQSTLTRRPSSRRQEGAEAEKLSPWLC